MADNINNDDKKKNDPAANFKAAGSLSGKAEKPADEKVAAPIQNKRTAPSDSSTTASVSDKTAKTPADKTPAPASDRTVRTPIDRTSAPASDRTARTPVDRTAAPANGRTARTPVDRAAAPASGRTTRTPVDRAAAPASGRTTRTPVDRTAAPISDRTTRTPVDRTSAPASDRTARPINDKLTPAKHPSTPRGRAMSSQVPAAQRKRPPSAADRANPNRRPNPMASVPPPMLYDEQAEQPQEPAAATGGRKRRRRPAPEPERRQPENPVLRKIKRVLAVLGTTLLSAFLVLVITGTIVGTALTVYVLEFMDESTDVTLKELESSSNTIVYAQDANGKLIQLYAVTNEIQRIPIDISKVPQHVRDAFVAIEDERFYSHDGVDYKRTFAAFANMFLHIYDTQQGGSTITQQLIKNLTGDDEVSPERKIREIFRAMQFEKKYSKDEILESYLNYIGFGGPINGIQLASLEYFGKDVSELSIAEAACLAAIPQSPEVLNPFADPYKDKNGEIVYAGREANKKRQKNVLSHMYSNGAISYDQYKEALDEKLIFKGSKEYDELHPKTEEEKALEKSKNTATSWVVDTALREYAAVLMEEYGIDESEAIRRINTGGYQIYTTVDLNMQAYVEDKYSDLNNLMDADYNSTWEDTDDDGEYEQIFPQSAFIAMNYDGEILCVAGGIGEKTESLAFNRATMAKRQPGSCMKPVSTYGLALLSDHIHFGSVYKDSPIKLEDGKEWPPNYDYVWRRSNMFIFEALRQSRNTVPAQLCKELTPQAVFDFSTKNLHMDLVEETEEGATDIAYAPLTIGALTYGVSPENLVNAYLPYGNGGVYCSAHIVSKVEKGDGTVVYTNDGHPHEAVDPESAYVMNKLLEEVVKSGTGTSAQLSNKTVVGKTGTSEDWNDIAFVGLTPDFVSGVWIGYDTKNELNHGLSSAGVWYNIIGEYANSLETDKSFPECDSVVEAPMCSVSGMIATGACGSNRTGYWKSTNAPSCTGHTAYITQPVTTTQPPQQPNEPPPAEPQPAEQPPAEPAEPQPPAEQPGEEGGE